MPSLPAVVLMVACLAAGCGGVVAPLPAVDASPDGAGSPDAAVDAPPCTMAYRQAVAADHPMAYFPLDDRDPAPVAEDVSGNGHVATYDGTPALQSATALPAMCGAAVGFSGDDFLSAELPGINTAPGGYVTVELWMKWNGDPLEMPIAFGTYDLELLDPSHIGFNTNDGDLWGVERGDLVGRWVHVVAAFSNGSTQNNRLYLDGVAQPLDDFGVNPSGGKSVTSKFFIGRYESTEGQGYKFAGSLDEVAVYNTELRASRVMAHYQAAMRP